MSDVRATAATDYAPDDLGTPGWDPEHNGDALTVGDDGATITWDAAKRSGSDAGSFAWVPAATLLHLHSGRFRFDFAVTGMGGRQIGVGFMLQLTDGTNIGADWGFFGYLGASHTAWAYDPSTGDVVSATESIEGGLPRFAGGEGGTVTLELDLPREELPGHATFIVDGTASTPIELPTGAVVLPAACLLAVGQTVALRYARGQFVEISFPAHADGPAFHRSDLEQDLIDDLGDLLEVTGGGSGVGGSNLDVELHDTRDLDRLLTYLRAYDLPPGTVAIAGETRHAVA